MIRRLSFTVSSLALALVAQAPAFAQSAAATPAADADQDNGAIVVTARRREEEVQDVPLAISVVDAAQINNTGSFNIQRLQQLQPTLQFFTSNPRNSAINIRGIGAPFGLTNDGIEQGVGIYVDGIYYNRVASATFDFVDIERIEVLRGPQGTLYGKNTTAGAINITTRKPSFDFEGRAELTAGNYNFKQAKLSVSGPLTDNVAVRLGLSTTDRRGTIYNVATRQWVQSQDNVGVRGQLLWRATDNLDITITGDYNLQDANCCVQIYARVGQTQRALNRQYAALTAAFNYKVPSTNAFDRLTDLDAEIRARNEVGGASILAEWDLGAGTLTSATAFRYWDWKPANDRDFTGLPVYTKVNNPTKQRQYTQELRYAQTGETFDFVAGVFAFYQEIRTSGIQETGTAASRWLLAPNASPTAPVNNPQALNNVLAINAIQLDNLSLAGFGQLTWHATDKLRIQPGIRLNYDKKDGIYNSVVTGNASTGQRSVIDFNTANPLYNDPWLVAARGVQSSQYFEPKYSAWNLSYDLTVSYDFSRDILGYATYAKAFKSGGVNLNGVPNDAQNRPILAVGTVRPEKVDHFEVGLKTQLWDRKATVNLAGFWTEIKDFQANVTNGQFGVIRGYLANAQKVRVRGIEGDASIRPSDRFSAYGSAAYTDHEYVSFKDAPCPPELSGGGTGTPIAAPGAVGNSPANCDISGQWLPGISNWSLSWGAEANVPATIFGLEGQVYLGYDASYRSKFSSNASRSIYTDIAGYSIHNLRAGFRAGNDFNIYGWVRNLFDKDYYEQLAVTSGSTGLISGQPGDPQTWGVTVAKSF